VLLRLLLLLLLLLLDIAAAAASGLASLLHENLARGFAGLVPVQLADPGAYADGNDFLHRHPTLCLEFLRVSEAPAHRRRHEGLDFTSQGSVARLVDLVEQHLDEQGELQPLHREGGDVRCVAWMLRLCRLRGLPHLRSRCCRFGERGLSWCRFGSGHGTWLQQMHLTVHDGAASLLADSIDHCCLGLAWSLLLV